MTASHRDIEAEIPRLRRYARALVRDVGAADDLVQDCLARALSRLHLWQEGTNLRVWLFTILHNQHVNRIRESIRAGTPVELSEAGSLLSQPANQDGCLELRDLERALARLPEEQRAVILLVGLEGMRYEHAGAVLGIPTGTVRSRLSRGRDALRRLMDGGPCADRVLPAGPPRNAPPRSRSVNAARPSAQPNGSWARPRLPSAA